jgi:hypothetical protein
MKKVARSFLIAFLFLSLFGCIEVVYEIGIDENDLEHLTMRMGMPAILAPYIGDVVAKVKDEGFTVTTETQGDKVWIIGTKEFPKGSWDIPALPGSVTVTTVTRDVFKVDDYVLFKKYTLDAEYQYENSSMPDPTTGGSTMYSVPVKFMITLPGTIIETNAQERQGRTAVWSYTLAPTGTIVMKLVTYKPKWVLVSALLFSLAVFAVAIVLLVVKSSRSRTAVPPRSPLGPSTRSKNATEVSSRIHGPTPPAATPSPSTQNDAVRYVVTLSLPPDTPTAAKIIGTLARTRNKTADDIIAELRAGGVTLGFSDKGVLERNVRILTNAGFNPKVVVRRG